MPGAAVKVIGLMSGTSMDAVDASLVEIAGNPRRPRVRLTAFHTARYPAVLRGRLTELASGEAATPLELAEVSARTAGVFASAARRVMKQAGLAPTEVDLVASHGQTVGHRGGKRACSVQVGEPAVIAEATGVTTVADFRVADIAAGGEGAPLAPLAHHLLFGNRRRTRAVQNLGGIGNVSWLPAGADADGVVGTDTGPANILIDACAVMLTGRTGAIDRGGARAGRGSPDERLVAEVLAQPFFRRRLPASTGREEFGAPLARRLIDQGRRRRLSSSDILASVTLATARSVARCYRRLSPSPPEEVWVCGGGAHNRTLMRMLEQELEGPKVMSTARLGVAPDAVEAVAFALLGYLAVRGWPGNLTSATGASGPRVLGKIVPGTNYRRVLLS